MAQIIILKRVRLSYPDLFKPGKPMNEGDTPKYGGQFIMGADSDAAKIAKDAMIKDAQEVFGANFAAIMGAMEKSKKFLRKGDENLTKDGAIRDGYAGNIYAVARNKVQPLIIGPRRVKPAGTNGEIDGRKYSEGFPVLTEADGKPYGGCFVNVKLSVNAMKAKEKIPNQVYASLLTVQFVEDGPAFGAAPGTAEGFDDEGDADAPLNTTGNADEFDPMA